MYSLRIPNHTYAVCMCVLVTFTFPIALVITLLFSLPALAQQTESPEQETPIQVRQLRALQFPRIVVSDASQNGFTCVANGVQNLQKQSLCPGKTGQTLQLALRGKANAFISVQHTSEPQQINGLQFNLLNTPINTILKADGEQIVEVAAVVQLLNKNAVKATRLPLSYDLVVVYQ